MVWAGLDGSRRCAVNVRGLRVLCWEARQIDCRCHVDDAAAARPWVVWHCVGGIHRLVVGSVAVGSSEIGSLHVPHELRLSRPRSHGCGGKSRVLRTGSVKCVIVGVFLMVFLSSLLGRRAESVNSSSKIHHFQSQPQLPTISATYPSGIVFEFLFFSLLTTISSSFVEAGIVCAARTAKGATAAPTTACAWPSARLARFARDWRTFPHLLYYIFLDAPS